MSGSLRTYLASFLLALLLMAPTVVPVKGQPMPGPMAGQMEFSSMNIYYPDRFYNRYEVNSTFQEEGEGEGSLELSASYYDGTLEGELSFNLSGVELNATGSLSLSVSVEFTANESNSSFMLSLFVDNSQFVPPGNGSLVLNVSIEVSASTTANLTAGEQNSTGSFTIRFSDRGDIAAGAEVEEIVFMIRGTFETRQNLTHLSFNVPFTIDVDTVPPQAAPGIAFLVFLLLQNLAQQLPPEITMEVSLSQQDPSIIEARIYGTIDFERPVEPPIEPPIPLGEMRAPQFNGSVVPMLGFDRGMVSVSLDAEIEPTTLTVLGSLLLSIDGSLSVPGAIELDSLNLLIQAESSDGEGMVEGFLEVNGTSTEPFTPFELNKLILSSIADMIESGMEDMMGAGPMSPMVDVFVEFIGFEGVMFSDSFGVSDRVVYTEDNFTEVEDLRLVYGGVEAEVENGTLRMVSRGEAVIGLAHLLEASRAIVVANTVTISAGPVTFVRDFELEIESEEGTISATIEAGSSLPGPAMIGVIDPSMAADLLETVGATDDLGPLSVIGPAVEIEVEPGTEASLELEIPVEQPPGGTIYVIVVGDNDYRVLTEFELEDSVLTIVLEEFSTVIPVVAEEAPPQEATETTTTTRETTPTETTPRETTTPIETTTPEKTTPPPEETTTPPPRTETTPRETTTPIDTTTPRETTPREETTPPKETTTPPEETTTPDKTTPPPEETTPEKTTPPPEETTTPPPPEGGEGPGIDINDIVIFVVVILIIGGSIIILIKKR